MSNPASEASEAGGGFVVSWAAEAPVSGADFLTLDVYMRRFDVAGNPLGPEVRAMAGGALDPATPAGVVMARDGSFVLGYQMRDPAIQRFAANGSPGRSSHVQHQGDSAAGYALIVAARNGGYLLAWTNYGVDSRLPPRFYTGPLPYPGNNAGVGARFLGANAGPRGAELEVNRFGPGEQDLSGLTPLQGGGFLAVWTDFSGRNGPGIDVYGRACAATGRPLTNDLHLSETTTGAQFLPIAASNAAGDIIVVWLQQPGIQRGLPEDLIARRLKVSAR